MGTQPGRACFFRNSGEKMSYFLSKFLENSGEKKFKILRKWIEAIQLGIWELSREGLAYPAKKWRILTDRRKGRTAKRKVAFDSPSSSDHAWNILDQNEPEVELILNGQYRDE